MPNVRNGSKADISEFHQSELVRGNECGNGPEFLHNSYGRVGQTPALLIQKADVFQKNSAISIVGRQPRTPGTFTPSRSLSQIIPTIRHPASASLNNWMLLIPRRSTSLSLGDVRAS